MSKNIFILPKIFSDLWLEDKYEDLIRIINEGELLLYFGYTFWIELSALVHLTSIIIKNANKINALSIILNPHNDDVGIKEAFFFLLESNFYLAINNAFNKDQKINIIFQLEKYNTTQLKNIKKAFDHYLESETTEIVDNLIVGENNFISLNVKDLIENRKVDVSFFSIIGYEQIASDRDRFIIPITHLELGKIEDYINNENSIKTLYNDLYQGESTLNYTSQEYLNELNQLWLYELLLNAKEHGKDSVVFCVRLGTWDVKNIFKKSIQEDILENSYKYKKDFLKRDPERKYNKYIDLYVVDFGKGFSSLIPAYEEEKNIKLKNRDILKVLHRYSLFHHTTKKIFKTSDEKPLTTGLGLISEQICINEAMFSIKDTTDLNYFEKKSIERASNEGEKEFRSSKNFSLTSISSIFAMPDESWFKRYHVLQHLPLEGDAPKLVVMHLNEVGNPIPKNILFVESSVKEKYVINKKNINLKSYKNIPFIIDLFPHKHLYKSVLDTIVKFIINLRKHEIPVIIMGARISDMKILQTLIDERNEGPDFIKESGIENNNIFAVMITDDYKLLWCGRLDSETRNILNKNLSSNNMFNNNVDSLLLNYGLENHGTIPLRTIDRVINKIHGKMFLKNLKKKHLIKAPIQFKDNIILDSYYEVKTYISDPSIYKLLIPDIRKFIICNDADCIIVDCPELVNIVEQSLKTYNTKPEIIQLENNRLDSLKGEFLKKAIIIRSATYRGKTFETIKKLTEEGWPIIKVISLLDLSVVKKEYPFKIDKYAKSNAPKKLNPTKFTPEYIVSKYGRLLPTEKLEREKDVKFKSAFPTHSTFSILNNCDSVLFGHQQGHNHHYDVHVNTRKSILENDRLCQMYRSMIRKRITDGFSIIVYPEESNLPSVLNAFRLGKGNEKIKLIPARHVFAEKFIWQNHNELHDFKGQKVIIAEESVYSGSTLNALLRLVKASKPERIDIVVMQKRFSEYSNDLVDAKSFKIPINFYCTIEIKTPVWEKQNCPYCSMKIPFNKEKPKRLNEVISLKKGLIETNANFTLWFVGGLYESRIKANRRIESVYNFKIGKIDELILSAKLIIIHIKQLENWGLIENSLRVIRRSMVYASMDEQCSITKLIGRLGNKYNSQIIKVAFQELIPLIEETSIYITFYNILKRDSSLLKEFVSFYEKKNYSDSVTNQCNALKNEIKKNEYSSNLHNFFALTAINRGIHHDKLSKELKECKYTKCNGLCAKTKCTIKPKIVYLQHVVQNINKTDASERMEKILKEKNVALLKNILEDETFKDIFISSYCHSSDTLINKISESVKAKIDKKIIESIHVERKILNKSKVQIPLVYAQPWVLDKICSHLENNSNHYGECDIFFEIKKHDDSYKINESLIIKCISKKQPDSTLEMARKTASLISIKTISNDNDIKIDYKYEGGNFCTELEFKIVDKIEKMEDLCLNTTF